MLTPEERRAQRAWREAQMTEDERLLKRIKNRERNRRRAKLLKEREIINGWNK